MYIKEHYPNDYYQYLLAVEGRVKLHDNDNINLYRYKLGEAGERKFYNMTKDIMEGFKIWDVTLDDNGSSQYDFLIVVNKIIYHFDVKNFSGSYLYKNDNFISENGRNYKNIMSQFDAAHERLIRIVKSNGWDYQVISKILFINKTFTIRNYNGNPNIMFAGQLPHYINQLTNSKTYKMDLYVAESILKLDNPKEYNRIHYYPINSMNSNPRCPYCKHFGIQINSQLKQVSCKCGHTMKKSELLHNICKEVLILNKGRLTANLLMQWSGVPERSTRRFLSIHYVKYGEKKNRYYTK